MTSQNQDDVTRADGASDADARRASRRRMMRLALAGAPVVLTLKARNAHAITGSPGSAGSTQLQGRQINDGTGGGYGGDGRGRTDRGVNVGGGGGGGGQDAK